MLGAQPWTIREAAGICASNLVWCEARTFCRNQVLPSHGAPKPGSKPVVGKVGPRVMATALGQEEPPWLHSAEARAEGSCQRPGQTPPSTSALGAGLAPRRYSNSVILESPGLEADKPTLGQEGNSPTSSHLNLPSGFRLSPEHTMILQRGVHLEGVRTGHQETNCLHHK